MKITVLGMNGPFPSANGATSGYLLESDTTKVLLDIGTGVLARLNAIYPAEKLNAVVLSHWHNDHASDLLPLMYQMQVRSKEPLHIYGPMDSASPIRSAIGNDDHFVLHTLTPGDTLSIGDFSLTIGQARHPVPAVLERWTCSGKTFVFTGDTNTVTGLTDFCRNADLLLADGLFPAAMWSEEKPHLSARLCAELAQAANVGQLVITHLHPDIDADTILNEARTIRPDAVLAEAWKMWKA